jgi:hypothetical protein
MATMVAFIDAGFLRAEGARTLGASPGEVRPLQPSELDQMVKVAAQP